MDGLDAGQCWIRPRVRTIEHALARPRRGPDGVELRFIFAGGWARPARPHVVQPVRSGVVGRELRQPLGLSLLAKSASDSDPRWRRGWERGQTGWDDLRFHGATD